MSNEKLFPKAENGNCVNTELDDAFQVNNLKGYKYISIGGWGEREAAFLFPNKFNPEKPSVIIFHSENIHLFDTSKKNLST